MLHIAHSFKCEYSSSNFNFISSFYYRKINVAVSLAMEQFEFFPVIPLTCHSNAMYMSCEWLNIKKEFQSHTNGLRETLFWLNRSNAF